MQLRFLNFLYYVPDEFVTPCVNKDYLTLPLFGPDGLLFSIVFNLL